MSSDCPVLTSMKTVHVLTKPAVSVFLCQTWAHPRVSASLMSPTRPPLFTGWFQEPGWTATRSLMCQLMEVSVRMCDTSTKTGKIWPFIAALSLDFKKKSSKLGKN